jgi:hypothetical protein
MSIWSNASSFYDVFNSENLPKLLSFAKDTTTTGIETFKEARMNAKIAGKLLAHYLAAENPTFKGHSLSLIGFSLGS